MLGGIAILYLPLQPRQAVEIAVFVVLGASVALYLTSDHRQRVPDPVPDGA
jgi:hypothetical protein